MLTLTDLNRNTCIYLSTHTQIAVLFLRNFQTHYHCRPKLSIKSSHCSLQNSRLKSNKLFFPFLYKIFIQYSVVHNTEWSVIVLWKQNLTCEKYFKLHFVHSGLKVKTLGLRSYMVGKAKSQEQIFSRDILTAVLVQSHGLIT